MRATPLSLGAAETYNVFTFSSFTGTSDAEGRVAVGGNFTSTGFSVGSHRDDRAGVYDLVVGGNLTNVDNSVKSGDVFVGGDLNWQNPTLPNDAYVNGNVKNAGFGSVGGTIFYVGDYSSKGDLNHKQVDKKTEAPIDFLSAKTDLRSVSTSLAAQKPNGEVAVSFNTYELKGTDKTINVFNLEGTTFRDATINITAPEGSTVIVNVAGEADSFRSGSINLNGIPSNNVIFNFSRAKTLALESIGFNATILAPFAAFTGTSGNVNGTLIAYSAAGTTEFHDYLFHGALPNVVTATPEPSTWMSVLSGGLLIALAGLKRSQTTSAPRR